MKMLSEMMDIVETLIAERGWTQKRAAEELGVTQPRISDLMRGKINLFSIDSLVTMIGKAGLHLQIGLKPPKA
jgi:predicted XRE-type DNA-binding protein